jgi:YVTN family beta-propeller protein
METNVARFRTSLEAAMAVVLFAVVGSVTSTVAAMLTLERTIPLPHVEGRIDHFAHDVAGGRLFVAALGNNSVEVVDLAAGRVIRSISGLAEPQGVFYLAEPGRLYVANGGDGSVRVFDGHSFAAVTTLSFGDDADNLRYDRSRKRLYVGFGGGALGIIDITTNEIVGRLPLRAHPESFQLEKTGSRVFVNVPSAHQIAVVDRESQKPLPPFSLGFVAANFPMALDEPNHRLFVASRAPARLLVFDTENGKEVARVDLHGDCDDLFFDSVRRQLYASCGEGFVDIFRQADADHYSLREAVTTEPKARTALLAGDFLFVAVPRRGDRSAEVRCYRIESPGL